MARNGSPGASPGCPANSTTAEALWRYVCIFGRVFVSLGAMRLLSLPCSIGLSAKG